MNDITKLPKWAQTELAEIKQQLLLAKALQFPNVPEPKPIPYDEIRKATDYANVPRVRLVTGWFFWVNGVNFSITEGCSDGVNHDSDGTKQTRSQGTGVMYRSKQDALLAARWSMCRNFAKALADLDAQLAKKQ